jgi:NADH-quinone oxidoreductase subunit G/NADP-reducing hydrogenase subunit HndD
MIKINQQEMEIIPGETVLEAARRGGIEIPHLCEFEGSPTPPAACRLCVVEVDKDPRLQTSCTLIAKDGMEVRTHTPKVLKARRNIMELLLASHPDDCLYCQKTGNCELADIATDLGIRERKYLGLKKKVPLDVSSPAIVHDPNKCILCGRCTTVCHVIQGVGAIDFTGRGYETRIAPAFYEGLNVSGCVFCGQCVRACPTGALLEKSHVEDVIRALKDPNIMVVAQIAPAIPATIASDGPLPSLVDSLELLAGLLKQMGFDAVYDTSFTADLTIMEEVSELIGRAKQGGALPMFTSCSPGWIRYVELYRPDLIPHLSTCKSPQQMAGTLIKEHYRQQGTGGKRVFTVSIMPCLAKKFEAADLGDVDLVLSTRELKDLLNRFGLQFSASGPRAALDVPFAAATSAGRIFGATGGVMEAAIRTAHYLLTGRNLVGDLKITPARGLNRLKIFTLAVEGLELGFAVVNGLGEVANLLKMMQRENLKLHFIEVMTCPGGCVGGGGQPYDTDEVKLKKRLKIIYDMDKKADKRLSHENEAVKNLYEKLLDRPLSEMSHHLLHRSYTPRGRGQAAM